MFYRDNYPRAVSDVLMLSDNIICVVDKYGSFIELYFEENENDMLNRETKGI